ncbi:hypothetical protein SOD_c42290 [Serratia plymuthica 4Rx13]|uniref:Uncharacterized protein n=1 Tax=Serratia plymuthica TaxID=82996 RepID=A0A318P141_SERPL|nr:hypothetical protein [Serratia plymuthica]AGO57178.1 hypothetical protein SOD_c42290 [Serratia plymuthica 4Rx13]PYD38355.1 hypothetical protein CT690_15880 [Serratia plymuthica]
MNIYKSISDEAEKLAAEAKTLEKIASRQQLCVEVVELLANVRQRLNVLTHMNDEASTGMKEEADADAIKRKPKRTIHTMSQGERIKRRLVKRGAILVRGYM